VTETKSAPALKWNYRGLIPFAILNTLFMYQFPVLFGEEKKQEILTGLIKDQDRTTSGRQEHWH